jgi:formylglycine-generating enzyme required for sulfatase activity
MRLLRFIAVAWLALTWALAPANAEKRVALVMGNGAYVHADKLANPVNDARGIRDALTVLKFDVIYGEDLDGKALRRKIGEFAGRVEGADVALVYFAGHGATFGDTPYVVPVDAEFSSLSEVPYELISLETLIGELRQAKGVRIAILDACRDNAAEGRLKRQAGARGGEVTRGLGPMKNPDGLILAYATQYLSTAADSAGSGNSPFTAALLKNIATPGLDVKDLFFNVGQEVVATTGGKQRPEISVSIYERYALVPAEAKPEPARPVAVPLPTGTAADEVTWRFLKDAGSADQLRRFITEYPASSHRREAEERLKALEHTTTSVTVTEPARPAEVVKPAGGPCGVGTAVSLLRSRQSAPLSAAEQCNLQPKDSFRECEDCPEMVVVPAGSFTMGSPESEKGRNDDERQSEVTIEKAFAVGKLHVTVDQYAAFVRETGHKASSTCFTFEGGKFEPRASRSWRNPGFVQEGSHPVVCVSWDDAKAYVDWLAKKTGEPYRLLSEAEWEYAARGRTSPGLYPRFWFGGDEKAFCQNGNGADQKAREIAGWRQTGWDTLPCNDGYAHTAPTGHYSQNAFGLYDMAGNAWQWTADCISFTFTTETCRGRVARGGSWSYNPKYLRAAARVGFSDVYEDIGFRVARSLNGPDADHR